MKKVVIFTLILCFSLLPSFLFAKDSLNAFSIYGDTREFQASKPVSNINQNVSLENVEVVSTIIAKRGCCSWHGGVCGCNEQGRVICCDGTLSPTCRCRPQRRDSGTATPEERVCDCSDNIYNCNDFSTQAEAQKCFEYCRSLGRGDIHRLDRDRDGRACEALP